MLTNRIILGIAVTEILFGGLTIFANFISLFLRFTQKSLPVFLFVMGTATISLSLGMGILNRRRAAVQMLIYFSSVIILSKILIFAGIIQLHWTLATNIPSAWKNMISLAYHAFIILYLSRPAVLREFR